jgi:predicted dehydrogenase
MGHAELNLLLIGCGEFAKNHLEGVETFANESECLSSLHVADVREESDIRRNLPSKFADFQYIRLDEHDSRSREKTLSAEHERRRFGACIISTRPRDHKLYSRWALSNGIPLMVDKPLTFPESANFSANAARLIVSEFHELVNTARDNHVLFLLGAQKRHQEIYKKLGEMIAGVYTRTRCPVTNVVCCTGDGWWLLPDEYEHSSYKFEGKLVHTGYHFLDIVPWLMRHAGPEANPISHAWVIASAFRPEEVCAAYGVEATRKLFEQDKTLSNSQGLGDVNMNLMVRLCDETNRQRAGILYSLLHEGFSKRCSAGDGTFNERQQTASRLRTKMDYLALTQGPVLWAELRRIAKVCDCGDESEVGGPAHQQLTVLSNELARPGMPLSVSNEPLFATSSGSESSCCENDQAPAIDFLYQVTQPERQPILSPVEDHCIAVKLLAAAYESAAGIDPRPIRVEFGPQEWGVPPGRSTFLANNDVARA